MSWPLAIAYSHMCICYVKYVYCNETRGNRIAYNTIYKNIHPSTHPNVYCVAPEKFANLSNNRLFTHEHHLSPILIQFKTNFHSRWTQIYSHISGYQAKESKNPDFLFHFHFYLDGFVLRISKALNDVTFQMAPKWINAECYKKSRRERVSCFPFVIKVLCIEFRVWCGPLLKAIPASIIIIIILSRKLLWWKKFHWTGHLDKVGQS